MFDFFYPHSWYRVSKFLRMPSTIGIFSVGRLLASYRIGAGHQRKQIMVRNLEFTVIQWNLYNGNKSWTLTSWLIMTKSQKNEMQGLYHWWTLPHDKGGTPQLPGDRLQHLNASTFSLLSFVLFTHWYFSAITFITNK